ncbi:MAG: mismatch-specific DNA-glycosylase [Pseudomonadota bacterium]
METLADYLDHDLRIVSVGLNPSLPSVRDGFYFSGKRNRFWRALNQSNLISHSIEPSVSAMDSLLHKHRIGFTDTVKRPTAGAGDLRVADYREWVPVLEEKLLTYSPAVVWFHGKVAYSYYRRFSNLRLIGETTWGAQDECIGRSTVFVTPNPSPANAVFSLDDLIRCYNSLAQYVNEQC